MQRAHHLAGGGAGLEARLAAQVAGVARARDAGAHERAVKRARHRRAQGRLAGARRSDQTQRGTRQIGLEAAHREVLDDALLGLGEPQVLALELGLDLAERGVLGGAVAPRERPQPLEVGAHLPGLGGLRRQAAQPVHVALRLARHLGRQVRHGHGVQGAALGRGGALVGGDSGLGPHAAARLAGGIALGSNRSGHWNSVRDAAAWRS